MRRPGAMAVAGLAAALLAGGLAHAGTASNTLPPESTAHYRAQSLQAPSGVKLKGVRYTTGPAGITHVTATFPGTLGLLSSLGALLDPYDVYMRFDGTSEIKCAVTLPSVLSGTSDTTATCDWTLQPVKQPADRPKPLRIRVV